MHDYQKDSIIISGWGLVSPLGQSAPETFSSLLAGRTIADRTAGLPSDIDPVDLVCAVGATSVMTSVPGDPAVELAQRAAQEALLMAHLEPKDVDCLIGTSKGAVHALISAIERHQTTARFRAYPPSDDRRTHPIADADLALALGSHGYLAHHLHRRMGLHSRPPIVAACASSLTALHQARTMLERNRCSTERRPILVVTTEASLLPHFIHSYRRLGVLGPLTPTGYRARPLDRRRCGFMLSEVAAAVVLNPIHRPQSGQIELVDTAIASDAYDLVRTAPDMPAVCHVARKLLTRRRIDLIHPHAPGTIEHDAAEMAAIGPHLSAQPPVDVYASKGALGHGLGASGLVSLVIACLCAKTDRRPAMPWLEDPINTDSISLALSQHPERTSLKTHAILASGFGGHVAGAVITKH